MFKLKQKNQSLQNYSIKANKSKIVVFIFLITSVIITTFYSKKQAHLLPKASTRPADIHVLVPIELNNWGNEWQALAQGGEEKTNMFTNIKKDIYQLKPQYIRIDHIFDYYNIVTQQPKGSTTYNWSKLDNTIFSILNTGAKPFIALSYTPTSLALNGLITDQPANWTQWQELIRQTVNHISGKSGLNIKDVYYEVWNEPDLFGQWSINNPKNYLSLYRYTSQAIKSLTNLNPYKIGGPAISSPNKEWITKLITFTRKNRLPLDFISWHRYHQNPQIFSEDVQSIKLWLQQAQASPSIELIISEWGSMPNMSPWHDQMVDAAHSLATIRELAGKIKFGFSFEIKDGPDPQGKPLWGRWGLISHGQNSIKKPRYYALLWANRLQNKRLMVIGENQWIRAMAAADQNKIGVLLVNYDPLSQHSEAVPISLSSIPNGRYLLKIEQLKQTKFNKKITVLNHIFKTKVYLQPNQFIWLELQPIKKSPSYPNPSPKQEKNINP